jgi:hypothetical protein
MSVLFVSGFDSYTIEDSVTKKNTKPTPKCKKCFPSKTIMRCHGCGVEKSYFYDTYVKDGKEHLICRSCAE